MQKFTTTSVVLLTIPCVLLAGCSEQTPALPEDAGESILAEDGTDRTRDAGEAAREAAREAEAAVEDYQRNMRASVEALNEQIDGLRERASTMTGDARTAIDNAITDLEVQRDAFIDRLNQAGTDTATAWDDVRRGLDEAWDELSESVRSAVERFGG